VIKIILEYPPHMHNGMNPLKPNLTGLSWLFKDAKGKPRDRSVGIATGYGLEGPGIESW
jgi:hypothetical protein